MSLLVFFGLFIAGFLFYSVSRHTQDLSTATVAAIGRHCQIQFKTTPLVILRTLKAGYILLEHTKP